MVAASRHPEDAAQQAKRVLESHRFHERVPGSDSLAKYAVAFLAHPFPSARPLVPSVIATSASSSATLRLPGGAVGSLPRLAALTQFASVPFGIEIRCAASLNVSPCASTNRLGAKLRRICWLRHVFTPFDKFIKWRCLFMSGYLSIPRLVKK